MSKVNLKINKKSQKTPTLKIVGIVFMIVTLVAALALTNNTVRQFITSSFAFDPSCAAKGSPSERRACQEPIDEARAAAAKAARAARAEKQRNQNQDTRLQNNGVDGPNYNHPIIYGIGGQNDPNYTPNNAQQQNNPAVQTNQTNIVPIGQVSTVQTQNQAVIKLINDYLKTHSLLDLMKSTLLNSGR